jgi:hypothetical protein
MGVWELGAEENIWTQVEESNNKLQKLHNKMLYNLYFSPDIIKMIKPRRIKQTGHIACLWDTRYTYKILIIKTKGNRPLSKHAYGG